jgi:hypothetical protein
MLFASLLAATQAAAQELVPSPPLAPDIAALPRLKGDGAVVSQINVRLHQLDERDLENVNCNYGSRSDDPFRSVEVLSDGPEFLSFLIATGAFCEGAAHPWSSQEIVNFDLETGTETDLLAFLPEHLWGAANPEDWLAVLFLNYVADLSVDCAQSYAFAQREDHLQFDLGLVEAQGALMLWPHGLAYLETPCLDAAFIPLTRMEDAGFHGRLLHALAPH